MAMDFGGAPDQADMDFLNDKGTGTYDAKTDSKSDRSDSSDRAKSSKERSKDDAKRGESADNDWKEDEPDDEDLSILNDDEPEDAEEDDDREDTDSKEKDREDEEEDDKAKLADDDEEIGHRRTNVKAIKEKYPKFFKDFPDARDVIFREQEFSKVFPTVEDAQVAQSKASNFDFLAEPLDRGESQPLLDALATNNPKAAERFIEGFLPTIYKANQNLFFRITAPVVKAALRNAMSEAKRIKSEALEASVENIAQFLFNDKDISSSRDVKHDRREPEKDEAYEKEKKEFFETRQKEAREGTARTLNSKVDTFIEAKLKDDESITSFELRNITRDVKEKLDNALANDSQHMKMMGSLWRAAERANWSAESMKKIRTTYLTRAQLLLPPILRKVKSEAFESRRKQRRDSDGDDERDTHRDRARQTRISSGRPPSRDSERITSKDVDWNKHPSDKDILDGKIPVRGQR